MAGNKRIMIWMDYTVAYLTESRNDILETTIINSPAATSGKGAYREPHGQADIRYCMKLGEVISNCDEVVLLGPDDAKLELLMILRANYLFSQIKIELKMADRMSLDEQHVFFRGHFIGSPGNM